MADSLYQLTEEFSSLRDAVEWTDPETGEVLEGDALLPILAALKGDIAQKAGGVLCVAAEFKHRAAAFKAEEDRLAKRRKVLENAAERLKAYVRDSMEAMQLKKLEANTFKVVLVAGRETVAMDPERREDVPEQLRTYEWKPLTKEATEQFKETGTLPPGFTVKRGESYVRIS